MIDKQTIFEIHRLSHLGWSVRKIARNLRICRASVKRHLAGPSAAEKKAARASKLDSYRDLIVQFLDQDDSFRARMVEQVCHIEHYKAEVREKEGRAISGEEAAQEWIRKYAKDFPST